MAERWSALEQAGNAWIDWANDDAMTADKVQHAINGVSNPAAQAILNRWWGQLNGRSKWTLRLVSGAADPGHTTRRQVSVDGMGNVTWTKGPVHQWDAETGHDYRAVPINERDIAFDWEPGEPFRVVVESYWTYLRGGVAPNQINKTFNGPMAVCRAHHQGGVRKDEEPTLTIWFEIAGCPGPPRSFCKPIFSSSSSVSRF